MEGVTILETAQKVLETYTKTHWCTHTSAVQARAPIMELRKQEWRCPSCDTASECRVLECACRLSAHDP